MTLLGFAGASNGGTPGNLTVSFGFTAEANDVIAVCIIRSATNTHIPAGWTRELNAFALDGSLFGYIYTRVAAGGESSETFEGDVEVGAVIAHTDWDPDTAVAPPDSFLDGSYLTDSGAGPVTISHPGAVLGPFGFKIHNAFWFSKGPAGGTFTPDYVVAGAFTDDEVSAGTFTDAFGGNDWTLSASYFFQTDPADDLGEHGATWDDVTFESLAQLCVFTLGDPLTPSGSVPQAFIPETKIVLRDLPNRSMPWEEDLLELGWV